MREAPMVVPGDRVKFADGNAAVSTDELVICTGICNGPAVYDEKNDVWFVPLFASRDNGREPTTIYVHEANLMGSVS